MAEMNSLFPNEDETQYIRKNKAMEMLGLSRHTFEKAQEQGHFQSRSIDGAKGKTVVVYSVNELQDFMQTAEYKAFIEGTVDERNSLNDMTGKEWLPETKSYFFQKGLGADHPDARGQYRSRRERKARAGNV